MNLSSPAATKDSIFMGSPTRVAHRIVSKAYPRSDFLGSDFFSETAERGLSVILAGLRIDRPDFQIQDLITLLTQPEELLHLETRLHTHKVNAQAAEEITLFLNNFRSSETNEHFQSRRIYLLFAEVSLHLHRLQMVKNGSH